MYLCTMKNRSAFSTLLFFLLLNAKCTSTMAQVHFWGMTNEGGQYGLGSIFSTDSTGGSEQLQYSFNGVDGAKPLFTQLLDGGNGSLYGMAYEGGAYDLGVLFKFDPVTASYTKLLDFDSIHGSKPLGSLFRNVDGKFYGMAYKGGSSNKGILFQFDPVTAGFTTLHSFDTLEGHLPYSTLIALSSLANGMVDAGSFSEGCIVYPNPCADMCTIRSTHRCQVSLVDIFGREITRSELNSGNNYKMQVSGLSRGMYFIFSPNFSGINPIKLMVQ